MLPWLPLLLVLTTPPHDTVVVVSFSLPGPLTAPTGDTVYYSPARTLEPSDFIGSPRYHGSSGAVSFTSFAYGGSSRLQRDTLQLHLFLQVFFVKSASWLLPEMANPSTLAHEQLHFDLTYLVAMRFRQKILSLQLAADDYDSIIQYEYLDAFREMNQVQERYDADTRNGTGSLAQQAWASQVEKWLNMASRNMPIPALQSPW